MTQETASSPAASALEKCRDRTRDGVAAALISYTLWGFLPIYFKAVAAVPSLEVLAHRIIWAVPFGVPIIILGRRWPEVRRALSHRPTLRLLTLSATVIAVNWLVYIGAVQHDEILQASLGYYINPLIYVLVGVVFFGERLRRLQTAAVLLAAAGVAVLTFSGGKFPTIALTLAVAFTIYGVIRSRVAVGGMPGLFIETSLLFPFAAGYLVWLMSAGAAVFRPGDPRMMGILMLAGPLTVLPLLCFALAARRLKLSTVGVMQFITPTLQFAVAVAYGERLTIPHVVCFALIWIAVAIFSWDAWRGARARQ
ncbi:MAG TPA: EamA family transporter RarD [Gammaproteobacteria bacterium]|nr:EamA family transporter RarD [Gammaproteobacteria bacterium]